MTPIEQSIESIVDGILLDYGNGRTIDRLDPFQQPDKEVVIDMIGKLIRIVYPGYSRDKSYRIYNARHNLSMLIEDVMYNLNKQIAIVLRPRLGRRKPPGVPRKSALRSSAPFPMSGQWPRRMWRLSLRGIRRLTAATRSFSAIPACSP